MRSLPTRRVPRNFTLDPALYGRPQRQPLGRAYPVLRAATAFTALLIVIALAANMFLNDITVRNVAQEAAMAPAMEMAIEEAPRVTEAESAAEDITAPAEEAPVAAEVEMAVEAIPELELAETQPAEAFMLEESLETAADEVPVEVLEAEEALPEGAAAEATSAKEEAIGDGELPAEKPLEQLPPALEIVEETTESSASPERQALTAATATAAPEGLQAPPAQPLATLPAGLDESLEPLPPPESEPVSRTFLPGFIVPGPLIIGLVILFAVLIFLTLVARGQR